MNKKTVTGAGTVTLKAGELDNRNIGAIVSFSFDGEWVVATLAAVVNNENETTLYAAHMPNDEWVLSSDEPIYVTQQLTTRFMYDIRRALGDIEDAMAVGGERA